MGSPESSEEMQFTMRETLLIRTSLIAVGVYEDGFCVSIELLTTQAAGGSFRRASLSAVEENPTAE